MKAYSMKSLGCQLSFCEMAVQLTWSSGYITLFKGQFQCFHNSYSHRCMIAVRKISVQLLAARTKPKCLVGYLIQTRSIVI